MNEIYIDDQNQTSLRWCVLEDDGDSAWLYITESGNQKPSADAFVYNRIEPIKTADVKNYSAGPPPIAESYATNYALISNPEGYKFSFIWSDDGESVAVLKDGNAIAMIIATEKYGFSKGVGRSGPWGHPWDQHLFEQTFAEQKY